MPLIFVGLRMISFRKIHAIHTCLFFLSSQNVFTAYSQRCINCTNANWILLVLIFRFLIENLNICPPFPGICGNKQRLRAYVANMCVWIVCFIDVVLKNSYHLICMWISWAEKEQDEYCNSFSKSYSRSNGLRECILFCPQKGNYEQTQIMFEVLCMHFCTCTGCSMEYCPLRWPKSQANCSLTRHAARFSYDNLHNAIVH